MNISELHQMHARHLAALRRSPLTIKHYRSVASVLERWMRERGMEPDPELLNRHLLSEFTLWNRERGLSPGGEHAILRAVRGMLRWAFDEELITHDPTLKMKFPSLPSTPPPAVQPHEVQALLAVVKGWRHPLRDHAMLLTLYDTGLRTGELVALRVSDVDLVKGVIHVRADTAKREKARIVPVGTKAARAITRYERHERKPANQFVEQLFLSRDGTPMGHSVLGQLLNRLAIAAKIPRENCAPHAWRRGFAVEFLRAGGDVFALQQILGHASLQMTRRYSTYLPEDLQRVHLRASPADRL